MKSKRNALLSEELELRSVLDSLSDGVLLYDLSGRILFANARLAELLGLDSGTIGNLAGAEEWRQLIEERSHPPADSPRPRPTAILQTGDATRKELEIGWPVQRVLECVSRPVRDAAGHATGRLEIFRDITAERQIAPKRLHTEKMVALGQLVSGIAHELNNPLTAIMGYAQLLLGRGLALPELEDANRIFQQAERARHIVKNLLYFSREAKPERVRVNLNEVAERTLTLRSYELKAENIQVETDLAPGLLETMADPHQLQQVILNLLLNAEQAILEGHGSGHIWLRTFLTSRQRLGLEIIDDGPGIPPDVLTRIFDPFFTTKPPGLGTGLGLSIIYGILQEHDGEISVESDREQGAKFVIELPAVPASVDVADSRWPAHEAEAQVRRERCVSPRRVLVVEDEPTVAQLISDVLREEGHQVDAVYDSQEGLTRIARNGYDLVICDLRMPRLDGSAFYEALRAAGSPMQNRIIFITGDTLGRLTREFLEPRGLPYLAKPFLVEELKIAVNRALEDVHASA
ncbi:MAG: hybrid sensor histidine kinase/response regulator [Candidatus Acidiferrales bacterium]